MKLAILVALIALAVPAAALGALGITSSTSVSTTVTLNGLDQSATFSTTLTISGGGPAGWNVTAWAPRPSGSAGTLGAIYVASRPSGACSGKNCVNPTPTGLSWPMTLGTSSGGAVKIYNAAASTGTGTVTVTVPFTSDVAANTLTGSYSSTITVAISSGP